MGNELRVNRNCSVAPFQVVTRERSQICANLSEIRHCLSKTSLFMTLSWNAIGRRWCGGMRAV